MIERLVPAGEGLVARIRCSQRSDGDFRCDLNGNLSPAHHGRLDRRREALMGGQWTWLRQVHGAKVVAVTEPGGGAGSAADGAVTEVPGVVLAVHTADCAPVVVVGDGAVGVAHAGWRGIVAGVLTEVVRAMRDLPACSGGTGLRTVVGPLIRPSAYEFGPAELAAVTGAARCDVGSVTSWGTPALDLVAAVRGALSTAGVSDVEDLGFDTAHESFFSHRVRGELARQATTVRLEHA
ncbi:MAG: polyphenol oxidase family protein [Acidimicrobiaceae bacterium]|nr:polyphenol oxidase family protein [Acidimicrobiaceae bacterium]MYE09203.1 polyphenol oxidase family protein [Acidimicrobiaceae bacterium]MYI36426.1 polyphenol oxidase family protein [Acidimicrobiaceae bacterium]